MSFTDLRAANGKDAGISGETSPPLDVENLFRDLSYSEMDSLEYRFAMLASLRPGWDGEGSLAPRRATLSVLYSVAQQLRAYRNEFRLSAHADGYVALTIRRDDVTLMADIYESHIEYFRNGTEWEGALDTEQLTDFIVDA